jgi:outer membrane protein OmpA-like peptidoglycan-associated protein
MKHLNKLFSVICLLVVFGSQAQDNDNPWSVTFGVNAVDTKVSAASSIKDQLSGYFDTKKNWNSQPAISFLNVSKYVGNNFSFGVSGSVNKISKFVNERVAPSSDYVVTNPRDLTYYGVDGVIKYSLMNVIKSKRLDPYAHIGGGYTFIGDASAGTVNGGLGLNFMFNKTIGLSLQSTYKHSFDETRTPNVDIASHMLHSAGLIIKFGGSDKDGDGVYDKNDACPEIPGLKKFKGCPDTDADGVTDAKDECPTDKGLVELNGCPDSDKDGIADKIDACPEYAGINEFNGCPDTDKDGIADKEDNCPTVNGPKENAGCPWSDTDGDSVLDKDDQCLNVKGTIANNGCPEISPESIKKMNENFKSILFSKGAPDLKKDSYPLLNAIVAVLKEFPTAKFRLEGHADSEGSVSPNIKLSQDRADSVRNFLIENGVAADRLTAVGFGESKPIDTNDTEKGKARNRRVEVKLVK